MDIIYAEALDAYSAALDAHGHDGWGAEARCLCGWKPGRAVREPRRSIGRHIGAAGRRAWAECETAMTQARLAARQSV